MKYLDFDRGGRIVTIIVTGAELESLKRYRESSLRLEDIRRLCRLQRSAPEVLRKTRRRRPSRAAR